ncbi:MAG TPA: rhamnan synthesis F family protein [Caldimonas sp.]|nr:rhamnan synthesis F family protein [Caldimonas sp.]
MASLSDRLRSWRRAVKAKLPYVRRREHGVLQRQYADLIEALDAPPATSAAWTWVKPLDQPLAGDVCFFVTHADGPALKPHVVDHVAHLAAAGLQVVLIANRSIPAADAQGLALEPALLARTRAVAVRGNEGYDFGAWAHALALVPPEPAWMRLFLVNDSVVGPLDLAAFQRLMARIRASHADVIGLTEALSPVRHLQSWFLVFGPRALHGGTVARLFARVRNWPAKKQVIDVHETRLTRLLEAEGLATEAMFPSLSGDARSSDDTSLRWAELVERGMPYLKTRVLAVHGDDPRIRRWVAAKPAPP